MLLAWQDSSELRQLLSQLSCAGERSGRGETLPAGAEEGSRCVIPFCSLDGRDHRANAGHKVSTAPLKSHMPPRTIDPPTHVWQSTSAPGGLPWRSLFTRSCAAPGASDITRCPSSSTKTPLLTEVPGLPRGHREPGTRVTA